MIDAVTDATRYVVCDVAGGLKHHGHIHCVATRHKKNGGDKPAGITEKRSVVEKLLKDSTATATALAAAGSFEPS